MSEQAAQAPRIDGSWDPAFAAVVDAFRSNFIEDGEWGAAVCVIAGGRPVVDVWGGWRDAAGTLAWREDTLVNAYSVGKAVLAMLVLDAVERGELDLDGRVSDVWSEFAAADKRHVTLRQALSHQAGVPAIRELLPAEARYDWTRMTSALANERPFWEPGTAHGYHANTLGYLIGEVLRRAAGHGPGELLRQRLAGPIGADYYWGLPAPLHERVAEVVLADVNRPLPEEPDGEIGHPGMVWRAYFNPPGMSGFGSVNTPQWRSAVIPSTNGHATARGIAWLFDHLLHGRRRGRPWVSAALRAEATRVQVDGHDVLLDRNSRFGLGFQLPEPDRPMGPNDGAFGHFGYGGSLGMADPAADVTFGYVTSKPGARFLASRTSRVLQALYAVL